MHTRHAHTIWSLVAHDMSTRHAPTIWSGPYRGSMSCKQWTLSCVRPDHVVGAVDVSHDMVRGTHDMVNFCSTRHGPHDMVDKCSPRHGPLHPRHHHTTWSYTTRHGPHDMVICSPRHGAHIGHPHDMVRAPHDMVAHPTTWLHDILFFGCARV